eukprot:7115786-Pyramimonas_sp.AAC.3
MGTIGAFRLRVDPEKADKLFDPPLTNMKVFLLPLVTGIRQTSFGIHYAKGYFYLKNNAAGKSKSESVIVQTLNR